MQESIREILGFTDEWFELGIITEDKLEEFKQQYESGEDLNSEHYRWRAFAAFVKTRESFDEQTIRRLYRLGETDADSAMGGSMMVEILSLKECPVDLLENAAINNRKFLRVAAQRELTKRNRNQTA